MPLIVIEGADRLGKSTQVDLLVKNLPTHDPSLRCVKIEFPVRDTPTGQLIDQFLKKEVRLPPNTVNLLFSANRWEMEERLMELLKDGNCFVVLGRYVHSGRVYATETSTTLDAATKKRILSMDEGLPVPDHTFLFQGEYRNEMSDGEVYDIGDFQEKISRRFQDTELQYTQQMHKIQVNHPSDMTRMKDRDVIHSEIIQTLVKGGALTNKQ